MLATIRMGIGAGWARQNDPSYLRSSHASTEDPPGEALSLAKDRRNSYGENDKASRKNIPRAKARVDRANRHQDRQTSDNAVGAPGDERDDAVEQALLDRRRKGMA